ncbi:Peptidase S9, prolyl oligopeptidase, catalytic domain [Penicillium roqueforti FM164]|uniref:Peptidase S9, prolyl oligopeptidase, catalytic domain n=1 Tax=Penicillium roqueforti (strain FM164) TaxID=1365484 RepID=W6QAJ9_PENRF|nr:Peptidase S9, prolyl oligopeptidase, catalytic domain [Penicillium roqueforti FM164]
MGPAQHAGNWKTPQLIIHGALNLESALLIFPDEGHQIRSPENLLLWYRTVLDWLKKHTRQDA